MKSRLLPLPVDQESTPSSAPARRAVDQKQTALPEISPHPSAKVEPYEAAGYASPQVSTRPQGRLIVAAILLVCVATLLSVLWSTFLRDAAYGVVTGRVVKLSAPWPGTVQVVHARAGENRFAGEPLVEIVDPEIEGELQRLGDELRAARAELQAREVQISLAVAQREDEVQQLRANYHKLLGELDVERARLNDVGSKLQRRQALAGRRAFSDEEIESLKFTRSGLEAKIENLQSAVRSLETRLRSYDSNDDAAVQLLPWRAKIENLQAELKRLREKKARGTLLAESFGTVVAIHADKGEYVTIEQPLVEFLPKESIEFVLYVKQAAASKFWIGQNLEVEVEGAERWIQSHVVRIGKRYEDPAAQLADRYRPDEALLPVYLVPNRRITQHESLQLGSTIRLPNSLFGN